MCRRAIRSVRKCSKKCHTMKSKADKPGCLKRCRRLRKLRRQHCRSHRKASSTSPKLKNPFREASRNDRKIKSISVSSVSLNAKLKNPFRVKFRRRKARRGGSKRRPIHRRRRRRRRRKPINPFRRKRNKSNYSLRKTKKKKLTNPYRNQKRKQKKRKSVKKPLNPFRKHKAKKNSNIGRKSENPFRKRNLKKSVEKDEGSKSTLADFWRDETGMEHRKPHIRVSSDIKSETDTKCFKKYFLMIKKELKFRRREHRHLDVILKRANKCKDYSCKKQFEQSLRHSRRSMNRLRRVRKTRRNRLHCAAAARASLGLAHRRNNNVCFLKYDQLQKREVKKLAKLEKRVKYFLKKAKVCKNQRCQKKNERLARSAEDYLQKKTKKYSKRRKHLPCAAAAKSADKAQLAVGIDRSIGTGNSGESMGRSTETGMTGLPLWAIPVIVGGVLLLGVAILVAALFIGQRLEKKKLEAAENNPDSYVKLDDGPIPLEK